jgi:GntR family transcriptional regulator of arabinose operon
MAQSKKFVLLYDDIMNEISSGKYLPGEKLPTENELADGHKVSRQTVRRALEQLETEGLIYKVQGSGAFIAETAKKLRRSMRIAVITTYISEHVFPPMLREIERVTAENGYSMLLSATNNSIAKERDILTGLLTNPVDGIIIEGTKTALPNPNISIFKELASRQIPLVFLNACYPELMDGSVPNIICLKVDDYEGGFEMTTDLIRQGHRSICGIFKSDDIQGIHRFSGYMNAMTINNANLCDRHMLWYTTENKFNIESILRPSGILDECTAVICYNDEIAAQVFRIVQNQFGCSISAVRSFDGVLKEAPMDFYSCPYPKSNMGRALAKKLISIIDGNKEDSAILPWYDDEI